MRGVDESMKVSSTDLFKGLAENLPPTPGSHM